MSVQRNKTFALNDSPLFLLQFSVTHISPSPTPADE